MSNKKIIRLICVILTIAFFFQSNMAVVAAFQANNVTNKQNLQDNLKKRDIPRLKDLVNKKPQKIPPGLVAKQDKFDKWKDKKELVEKRTSNSKTFDNGDGTNTVVQYFSPIHIKGSEGKFVDIDNSLVPEKDKAGTTNYRNKLGLYNILFN